MAATCDRPLRRCVNLSRRQHLRNALFDALHQLSGTHYRKLFSVVFTYRLKTFLFSRALSSFLLTNTLPGPSASGVTTLWRYTNLFIVIIIIIVVVIFFIVVVITNIVSTIKVNGLEFVQYISSR